MIVSFSKYHGLGNDFIFFDNRSKFFPIENSVLIQRLCHRRYGIGADGLILVETDTTQDFAMRIFNADGSEAEMCGNGIRCFMKFLQELGFNKESYRIKTLERELLIRSKNDQVCIDMGPSKNHLWNQNIQIDDVNYLGHYLNTGVPHFILFTKDLSLDILSLGKKIRNHSQFASKGTNVNFVKILSDSKIAIRTYERGVEDETYACGTGATAAALAAVQCHQLHLPLTVEVLAGDVLEIDAKQIDTGFTDVTMTGPAHFVYRGLIDFDPILL